VKGREGNTAGDNASGGRSFEGIAGKPEKSVCGAHHKKKRRNTVGNIGEKQGITGKRTK